MNLTRTSLSFIFILASIAVAPAQEQCKLNVAQSPTLRGLHLGMSTEQARAVFPGMKDGNVGDWGQIYASTYDSGTNKTMFQGISNINTTFYDNRLVQFSIQYNQSVRWDSTDQFIASISDSLHFPKSWEATGDFSKKLVCNGFSITVSTLNRAGSIGINEIGWEASAQKRIRDKEEKQRQAFKP